MRLLVILRLFNVFFLSYLLSVSVYAQETYTMENTKLVKGIRYDMQNRPLNGIVSVYYRTGELLLEMPYINGKANGIARGYRPDGSLFQEIRFKNSKEIKRYIYPSNQKFIL